MRSRLFVGVIAASLGLIATANAQSTPVQVQIPARDQQATPGAVSGPPAPESPEVEICASYAPPRGSDAFYRCLIARAEERVRLQGAIEAQEQAQALAQARAQADAAERARNIAIFGAALQSAGRAFQGPPQYNCTTTYFAGMAQTHCQ